jgi:hypothetical protein
MPRRYDDDDDDDDGSYSERPSRKKRRYDDEDDSDEFDFSNRSSRRRASETAGRVMGPALSMMICGILSFVFLFVYCPINLYVVFVEQGNIPKKQEEKVGEFIGAGVGVPLMAIASLVVAFGGYQMKSLGNYSSAMTAAILSLIPCCSPCCVVGIPFGIWALIVLNDPEVKSAFAS